MSRISVPAVAPENVSALVQDNDITVAPKEK